MFEMPVSKEPLVVESKDFFGQSDDDLFDEAMAWVEEGQKVALLHTEDSGSFVLMPIKVYESFDDVINSRSYLPHWELDQILVEDYPTVQDVLVGADDALLRACVQEVLSSALYPSEKPDLAGACWYTMRMLEALRGFEAKENNLTPVVVLPRCRYLCAEEEKIEREMQVIALGFDDAREGRLPKSPVNSMSSWSDVLGRKAWFGGVCIHDEYRALAWMLCTMHADGLVKYGVWMGGLPERLFTSPAVRELNSVADKELRARAKEAVGRTCGPDDLVTITFEMPQEAYQMFEAACSEKGLSIQNGMHIALRRLIAADE